MSAPIILMQNWYEVVVLANVDVKKCGIYEWRIEGVGSYIGKYKRIRRPTKEYGRNVTRLLNGRPYRLGKPDGFRRVHRALEQAHRRKRKITLIILENCDPSEINLRELHWIKLRGALNDPPFGRKIAS